MSTVSSPAPDDITQLLPRLLTGVERPGDFCGQGAVPCPVVRLAVDGVGVLGLPIPPVQAEVLVAAASPAPYGRGADTLHDPDVRRCGQISASALHLDDPRWVQLFTRIVADAAASLGVEGEVRAELYKLLVYQPGDFFTQHRDTEKVSGMFATLVIVLPAEHEGGELVVRHAGREAVLDLSGPDLGMARWAAFYADCQHELRPIRAGFRVALVYSLIWPKGRAPAVPDDRPTVRRVAEALQAWEASEEGPIKLVYPLAHRYTQAELGFGALKNEDAAIAGVLRSAAEAAGHTLKLAMVHIWESGAAEPSWDGRRRGRYNDDPRDYEVVEVFDRTCTLDDWCRPDDVREPLGRLPYDDEEVVPPGALDELEPDSDEFHEASGNEGCSFERTYLHAALVIWPRSQELEVLRRAGPTVGLGVLERALDDQDLARAGSMAELLVRDWQVPPERPDSAADPELASRLIAALQRLPDLRLLHDLLHDVIGAGAFDGKEAEAVLAALGRFDEPTAGRLLARLAASATRPRFAAVAGLIRAAGEARRGVWLTGALQAMIAGLPHVSTENTWFEQGAPELRVAGLVDLVGVTELVGDPIWVEGLSAAVLADPARWPLDEIVLPAALRLPGIAAAGALRQACRAHLEARVSLPLAPPPDARRSTAGLKCTCTHCKELRMFMEHPVTTVWRLRAVLADRNHVQAVITNARLDVSHETDRRGSPHTLVCTKNLASYEVRVKQRRADQEALGRLAG